MLKHKVIVSLFAAFSLFLCACSAAADTETINVTSEVLNEGHSASAEASDNSSDRAADTQSQASVAQSIETIAEYTYQDGIGWYTYHFMVVKNNSPETVDISTSSLAYASDGTMVGAANASFDALGAGCTSVMYEAFETDKDISRYETELSVSKSKFYKSVIQDLSYKQNELNNGAVFQVSNNGTEAAQFVEGYALFFLNGNLVDYESTYFTDDDFEIKAGKTISQQLTSYKDFDKIEFYLTGRR